MSDKEKIPDIEWAIKEIQIIGEVLSTVLANKDKYNTDDDSSVSLMGFTKRKIEELLDKIDSFKKSKVYVTGDPKIPYSLYLNDNSIFTKYYDLRASSYSNYFHKNLNPDISPPGFLETLDNLISIAKKEVLIIYVTDKLSLDVSMVISKYIEESIE